MVCTVLSSLSLSPLSLSLSNPPTPTVLLLAAVVEDVDSIEPLFYRVWSSSSLSSSLVLLLHLLFSSSSSSSFCWTQHLNLDLSMSLEWRYLRQQQQQQQLLLLLNHYRWRVNICEYIRWIATPWWGLRKFWHRHRPTVLVSSGCEWSVLLIGYRMIRSVPFQFQFVSLISFMWVFRHCVDSDYYSCFRSRPGTERLLLLSNRPVPPGAMQDPTYRERFDSWHPILNARCIGVAIQQCNNCATTICCSIPFCRHYAESKFLLPWTYCSCFFRLLPMTIL